MRKVGCFLLVAVVMGGCAESEEAPAGSTPIVDASPDVPGIEIGGSDTATADTATTDSATTDSAADAGSDTKADTAVVDTAVVDTAVAESAVLDTAVADTAVADTAVADTGIADTGTPYRHTITMDGTNDFTASAEKLATTTSSYDAYVTWDATALYIGYTGGDVSAASATKWLFVYLDVDPGTATGASASEQYATQKHTFPTGFGADYYYAWRSDGSSPQQKKYGSSAWSSMTASVTANRSGSYVEIKIPFSTFGTTPAKLGVVTYFLNEATGGEWTYAGLYSTSFTDGYSAATSPKTIGSYLRVDLASSVVPNSGANKLP